MSISFFKSLVSSLNHLLRKSSASIIIAPPPPPLIPPPPPSPFQFHFPDENDGYSSSTTTKDHNNNNKIIVDAETAQVEFDPMEASLILDADDLAGGKLHLPTADHNRVRYKKDHSFTKKKRLLLLLFILYLSQEANFCSKNVESPIVTAGRGAQPCRREGAYPRGN